MKVLNIDSLTKTDGRELVLLGKTYVVEGMTVGNFIETTKAALALGEDATLVQQVEATVSMIARAVPGIDRAELARLSLEQLKAVVDFVQGEDVAGVESREATEETGEKK